ncbi:MAG: hypothetical protein AAF560_03905 [Acidobacteriota bacterium]
MFPLRRALILSAAALLLPTSQILAVLCAQDTVPAATLLIPHFRVDLDACDQETGADTVITIVNTRAESTVAHMTWWTDWGVPTINFSLYLTGYDQQTIDLKPAFCDGFLPLTGPNVFSNHGSLSGPPPSLPNCELIEEGLSNPLLTGALLDRVRNGHTGSFDVSFGGCAGTDHGDNIARGYVTFDVINDCSLLFPSDAGYFLDVAAFDNVLMGEVLYLGPEGFQNEPAVHIEADPTGSEIQPDDRTFYGRYVAGSGQDLREPLPSILAANHSTLAAGSELLVWRETIATAAATCGTLPAGLPIAQSDLLVFDEEENPLSVFADAELATNALALDGIVPPGVVELGWLVLDERHAGVESLYGDDRAQAWVTYLSGPDPVAMASGRETFVLDNTCTGNGFGLPHRIFADGFESGDTAMWTNISP